MLQCKFLCHVLIFNQSMHKLKFKLKNRLLEVYCIYLFLAVMKADVTTTQYSSLLYKWKSARHNVKDKSLTGSNDCWGVSRLLKNTQILKLNWKPSNIVVTVQTKQWKWRCGLMWTQLLKIIPSSSQGILINNVFQIGTLGKGVDPVVSSMPHQHCQATFHDSSSLECNQEGCIINLRAYSDFEIDVEWKWTILVCVSHLMFI